MRKDVYHTFYGLSGLSLAQHRLDRRDLVGEVLGAKENLLEELNPVHGVPRVPLERAKRYYLANKVDL